MRIASLISAALVAYPAAASCRAVFAHVIVGNVASYDQTTWANDISLAQGVGIDGFVLNIATPYEGTISTQVANAFAAANANGNTFKLFFSFDYLGGAGAWASSQVIDILNQYGVNDAHYIEETTGSPLVSTFEGTSNIQGWSTIRSSVTNGIYFLPDWTSLGTSGFTSNINLVDGAFSWDMWPNGPTNITDTEDLAWQSAVAPKAFMMGVSPWFFTDLPAYSKQWVWRGDSMWHDRWQQVLEVDPEFVEIVTWNDYGESHYIGPICDACVPDVDDTSNAHDYVDGMPHDNWRDVLPYYISAYKNGGVAPEVTQEKVVYWYRLTPAAAGSSNGVTGNDCDYQACYDANEVVEDGVFVTALVSSHATITIQIGDNTAVPYTATGTGVHHFSQPFNGQTGEVTVQIVRNNVAVVSGTGAAILAAPADGTTNYNAWVGGASA